MFTDDELTAAVNLLTDCVAQHLHVRDAERGAGSGCRVESGIGQTRQAEELTMIETSDTQHNWEVKTMKSLNKIDSQYFETLIKIMAESGIPQDRVYHVYHYLQGNEHCSVTCSDAVQSYLECRASGDRTEVANWHSGPPRKNRG